MSRAVACDSGTMFFQVAENDSSGKLSLKEIRNAFVELEASEDIEQVLAQNDWQYVKDEKHYSLDDLCRLFNLKMHDRHTASGDAYLTALVFLKISKLLKAKKKKLQLRHFIGWF